MKLIHTRLKILLSVFLFSACNLGGGEVNRSERFESKLQLAVINEWEIRSPAVIPHPRFAGVLRDTSLVLVDRSLNTINRFDRKGALIDISGGVGRGPGEFSEISHAAINPDGRIAVADIKNARFTIINLFEDSLSTEKLNIGWHNRLHWVADTLVISNNPFNEAASHPGDIFMRLYHPETGEKETFYQLELEWGDTTPTDQISCTFCEHKFMDDLRFFTSPQDTSYRIYRVNPQTDKTLLFTRSGIPAVKYSERERKELQNQRRSTQQITGLNSEEDLPTYKSRFIDFFPDQSGRLWALLNPVEGEPPVFDIFSADAKYIGSVQAPEQVETIRFVSDNYILFQYDFENPDIWKGGLYKILEE